MRPYISDKGARSSGPNANEMRKIESVIARIVGLVMPSKIIRRYELMVNTKTVGGNGHTIFCPDIWQSWGHHRTT